MTIHCDYTLVSDGPSDRALLRVIDWVVHAAGVRAFDGTCVALQDYPDCPTGLAARVQLALELRPCDVLFVHRDAEREPRLVRVAEIRAAVEGLDEPPVVCVVPVRMTEAWLLHEEAAIREAAGNPNGTDPLTLPALSRLERIPDPKALLFEALLDATGFTGRRRQKKKRQRFWMRQRVAELISSFEPLRALPAFAAFEEEARVVMAPWRPGEEDAGF